MSLINDALRKAQHDAQRGRMSQVPGGFVIPPYRSRKRGSFMIVLTVVLLVGAAGWGVALYVALPDKRGVANTATPASSVKTEVAVSPAMDIPETIPAPVFVLDGGVEAADVREASESATPATPVTEAPVVPTAGSESVPQVVMSQAGLTAPASSDEIVFMLKQMDITAVMGDGEKARIMVGGQVHKAYELVDLELKLRFLGKKDGILLFADANGEVYEKTL